MIVLKVLLIGDGGVGKTAIRERYLGNGFDTEYMLTIGADFAKRDDFVYGTPVRYQIWDLAGQERFDGVREVYYKGAIGALLVFDVTRLDSYFNIPKWVKELWANNGRSKVPIVIVANKIDMRGSENQTISSEQGRLMAEKLTKITSPEGFACNYIETSAKTGVKINDAFSLLGENIMKYTEKRKIIKNKTSRSGQSVISQPVAKQL